MVNIKIGIVEDDLLIAESMVMILQQIGYRTAPPVRNFDEAIKMLESELLDLLLIDIRLDGELDGIDLAKRVLKDYGIPFIFVTANSDKDTVERAKEVRPAAFLVKPFNERDLYTAIEIAFSAFNQESQTTIGRELPIAYLKDVIFIKENNAFHKVSLDEILYIESENVYLTIYTRHRGYLVRTKLDDFIKRFEQGGFFRIHRSYAINIRHLESIQKTTVKVGGKDVPMNKNYKNALLNLIQSI